MSERGVIDLKLSLNDLLQDVVREENRYLVAVWESLVYFNVTRKSKLLSKLDNLHFCSETVLEDSRDFIMVWLPAIKNFLAFTACVPCLTLVVKNPR